MTTQIYDKQPAYRTEKPLTREDLRALLQLASPDYVPSENLKARIMAAIEKTPQDGKSPFTETPKEQ